MKYVNKKTRKVLIGSLLGDAYIEKNGINCRVVFDHSLNQLSYLKWKHTVFQPYVTAIMVYSIRDKRTKKIYKKARFKTLTKSFFNPYKELFYKNNKKCLPINFNPYLQSCLTLAVWYLDDGALRTDCKAFRIHTNAFSLKEVNQLKTILLNAFNIDSKPHKQGKGYNLYIGAFNKQAEKFSHLIKPIVALEIPSMLYKFF
jgi:LAGLIDADG DNA endonuclease family